MGVGVKWTKGAAAAGRETGWLVSAAVTAYAVKLDGDRVHLCTHTQSPVVRALVAAEPATFLRENSARYFSGRDVDGSTILRSSASTTSSGACTSVAMCVWVQGRSRTSGGSDSCCCCCCCGVRVCGVDALPNCDALWRVCALILGFSVG